MPPQHPCAVNDFAWGILPSTPRRPRGAVLVHVFTVRTVECLWGLDVIPAGFARVRLCARVRLSHGRNGRTVVRGGVRT